MNEMWKILFFFLFGYVLNMFFISVLYHRGLAHSSVILSPGLYKILAKTGIWMTGLEPLAWAAMHRLHHQHSDTSRDPHSPVYLGVWGVWKGQYVAYKKIVDHLIKKDDPKLNLLVKDIKMNISWVNRHGLSYLPYIFHAIMSFIFYSIFDSWFVGLAYFLGIMSHPVQGWMVNALAHKYGHRNYQTLDESKNNLFVAWFVFGEGLQNNHHAFPTSANFSRRGVELDAGYWMCLISEKLRILSITKK
jgi:stearoyl-CoA desaturase (Delta-9 desaturase)